MMSIPISTRLSIFSLPLLLSFLHLFCITAEAAAPEHETTIRPSCPVDFQPIRRVVGYYEGWASSSMCPWYDDADSLQSIYTHINFAYATIDSSTFQIRPAFKGDTEEYYKVTNKKRKDPNLKVFIAISGNAKHHSGLAASTLAAIAASQANQRAFLKSLVRFLYDHNFDGVDIEWPYTQGTNQLATSNLANFLANTKAALRQNGKRNGLSLAIPASEWHLQQFDLKEIAKHVDFFNFKTYDMHGVWTGREAWPGSHLAAPTNLTTIKDSLNILWRYQIDPDQVNLGLAFHTRLFKASQSDCLSPGCPFEEIGDSSSCTSEPGLKLNSEVKWVLDRERRSTPEQRPGKVSFDRDAAVKIYTASKYNEWMAFDDGETWKLKLDFARSQCLGGVFVSALTQDTSDAEFSKELQNLTGYNSSQVQWYAPVVSKSWWRTEEPDQNLIAGAQEYIKQEQCRWEKCGEGCPPGWKSVEREDEGSLGTRAAMIDDAGCGAEGGHTFCCPPGEQPRCEWQLMDEARAVACKESGQFEVSSVKTEESGPNSWLACCSGDTLSTKIYRKYRWQPKVDSLTSSKDSLMLPFEEMIRNITEPSGDIDDYLEYLKKNDYSGIEIPGTPGYERMFGECLLTNCVWYQSNIDRFSSQVEGHCNGNCPVGKIRMATQQGDCSTGEQALCCDAEVTARDYKWEREEGTMSREALEAWVKDPICPDALHEEL